MTRPMVGWRTAEEREAEERRARARVFEDAACARNHARSMRPETASPYDLVADALTSTVVDAVFAVLHSPDFAAALAERGLRIGPALDEEPPPAPEEWVSEVLDFMNVDGMPREPVELADELWGQAYRAGWEARSGGM